MTDIQKQKWVSRRFWITIWACLIVTIWGSSALVFDKAPPWLTGAMALLIAIPTAYVTITSIKKKEGEK